MKPILEILSRSVSVFPDVKNVNRCITTTVGEWLNGCKNPKNQNLMPLLEQIRQTSDKKERAALKIKLPAVVLGAEITTRSAKVPDAQKIIAITGLLCFDIDAQDNPGLKASDIRDKLSLCTNVIFAAVSVSGNGVWGLVEMEYPDKIKQHYTQLKVDFQALGIKLDASKGGNATDLRFYSYDPDAYLCHQYKVYDRLPQPKQPSFSKRRKPTNGLDPIKIATNKINSACDGEKHHELLKASRFLGGFVGGGCITFDEAQSTLETAINTKDIQSMSSAKKTIRDGLNYGMNAPIYMERKDFNLYIDKKTDPLIEYFRNLDVNSFEEIIMVDGVPLYNCIDTLIKSGDRFSLQALQIELKKLSSPEEKRTIIEQL